MKKIVELEDVNKRFLDVLKEYQGEKNNAEYADYLNISPGTLSNYQTGRLPQIDQLVKIRNNLKLPFGYLLGEVDVTNYDNDTENTFGLSKECVRKLETLNDEQLKCLSDFIVKCPSDILDVICDYSKLPIIKSRSIVLPIDKNVSYQDIAEYTMQTEFIRKQLLDNLEGVINSMKPPFSNITSIFTKEGKEIRVRLTTKITTSNINKDIYMK